MPDFNELMSRLREWWFIALLSFLVGAIPSWQPLLKEWFIPKFRFQAIHALVGRGAWFTQYTNWAEGWHADPIDLALYMRITNNDDSRARGISGYILEVRSNAGWRRLDRVELVPPAIFDATTLAGHKPTCIDFRENNLHARMRAGPMQAGQWIEGWVFFTSEGDPAYLTSLNRLRLTIYDTLDQKSTIEGPIPDKDDPRISMGIANMAVIGSDWVPPWRGGTTPPPKAESPAPDPSQ